MDTPFHLAVGVSDLKKAEEFYGRLLGAKKGRSDSLWVDFDFFGHQLTCHLIKNPCSFSTQINFVDGNSVPIPHFGVIVPPEKFEETAVRLKEARVHFVLEPQTRFKGRAGEQKTLFIKDPFGHFIEIKSYTGEAEYGGRRFL